MLRIIWINGLFLLGALVFLELIFGTWFSQAHALHQFTKPRDLRIERPNPVSETPATILYTRDENGFRGLKGDLSEIDLITVGGSTTDQRFLDDTQTYQAVLRDLSAKADTPWSIANAGIDGQTTFGHIENFSSWFDRLDTLRASYILFYVGLNDEMILSQKQYFDTIEAQSPKLRLQLLVREKSALYQLYLIAKQRFLTPEIDHAFGKGNMAKAPPYAEQGLLPTGTLDKDSARQALAALSERIKRLAKLTRGMGAEPIFVTQRSAAWRRVDGKVLGIPEMTPGFRSGLEAHFGEMNGLDLYEVERLLADAILAGCAAASAKCWDLMSELTFNIEEDFYDELHTTAAGSARIAEYLFPRLESLEGL